MRVHLASFMWGFVIVALSALSLPILAQEAAKKTSPVELSGSLESITATYCAAKAWKETGYSWGSCGDCWAKMTTRYTYSRNCYRYTNCSVSCSGWNLVSSKCMNSCSVIGNPPNE
ncbi:MAG: hypothetical protein KBD78_09725 [Oligoflexales bacterium]|nr:hypothetical protein [Oligoflexales bacterium]